jgi:hypothetical protein
MSPITFSDVVLVLSFADTSSLSLADSFLTQLESNEVETVKVTMRRTDSADVALHDYLIDFDPMSLEWCSVERQRKGRACTWVKGVDALPEVSQ